MYVYNVRTPWTKNDLALLSEKNEVSDCFYSKPSDHFKLSNPFFIFKHDVIVFWFASLSFFPIAFVAWLLRKDTIIIAGGFDVVKLPSIGYGGFANPWYKRIFRRFIYRKAKKVLSISKSNQNEALTNAKVSPDKSTIVSIGFFPKSIPLTPFEARKNKIISIGGITNETYLRKGHKYFLELARIMPDWQFVLVGKIAPDFKYLEDFKSCSNLTMTGFLPDEDLDDLLNESKYYVQLSHHEGFGCSIVDAALMGCYPIVFDRFAMPEVVEGCGSIVPPESVELVKQEILKGPSVEVEKMRVFYQDKFPMEKRKKALNRIISNFKGL